MIVEDILTKLKYDLINKSYDYIPTEKNRNSRRKFWLTTMNIEDFLLSLKRENLFKGPIQDYDYSDESVFIFIL